MRSAFPPKYAATSLILLTLLTTWALSAQLPILGVRNSDSIAAAIGSLLPAALCLWMTIRVTREHYRMQ